jgi:hypothetical protein
MFRRWNRLGNAPNQDFHETLGVFFFGMEQFGGFHWGIVAWHFYGVKNHKDVADAFMRSCMDERVIRIMLEK